MGREGGRGKGRNLGWVDDSRGEGGGEIDREMERIGEDRRG